MRLLCVLSTRVCVCVREREREIERERETETERDRVHTRVHSTQGRRIRLQCYILTFTFGDEVADADQMVRRIRRRMQAHAF